MSPLLPSSTFWALRDPTFWPSLRAWPSPLSDSWMSRVREPFSFLTPKAFPQGVQLFIGFEDPSHVPIGSFKFHHYLWFLFLEGRSFLPRTPRFSLWASYHFVFISRRLLDSLLTSQWFHLQEVLPIPCIVESPLLIHQMIYLWRIQYQLPWHILSLSMKLGCFFSVVL